MLKAPFPFFGGKRRVAHLVWERFGDVVNYVEPFFGSGAVLLDRPHEPRNETVNDLDCYISNFWRSVKHDPEAVARAADWPINEADLHARHRWLHSLAEFRERMHTDSDFFDAQGAGVWVWGLSAWIGDNWCRVDPQESYPHLDRGNKGVHSDRVLNGDGTGQDRRRPDVEDQGIHVKGGFGKMPNVTKGARGVNRKDPHGKRPEIRRGGRGVGADHALEPDNRIPDISGSRGASGRGVHAKYTRNLIEYMEALADRFRRVRVCCGDWHRILGPSPTTHIGITAVFLDPPYGHEARDKVYSVDSLQVAADVQAWCLERGADPKLRIALCGYAGEHECLELQGWDVLAWKASGGYARGERKENAKLERIWFSPGCLNVDRPVQQELFQDDE